LNIQDLEETKKEILAKVVEIEETKQMVSTRVFVAVV
jgi:hypothetical protein